MGMIDKSKVIKGLEIERECVSRDCDRDCGKCDLVQDRDWLLSVYDDALDLLKEQEPRVMTLDELKEIYVEFKGDNCPIRLTNFDLQKIVEYAVDGECRLWKGKPTDEQRKAVKWE